MHMLSMLQSANCFTVDFVIHIIAKDYIAASFFVRHAFLACF
jgi:hypothetical protein